MTVPDPRLAVAPVPGPPAGSGLCRLPLRSTEPPYDDDPHASGPPAPSMQGTLALVLPDVAPIRAAWPADIPPPRRAAGASLRLVPSPPAVPSGDHLAAGPAARVVVQAVVEVLSGTRPPSQLAGWTTPRLQLDLERRAGRAGRRSRCLLRSMRVSEPRPGVAEVSAVIRRGDRMAALALRMEAQRSRWRVTTLQVG